MKYKYWIEVYKTHKVWSSFGAHAYSNLKEARKYLKILKEYYPSSKFRLAEYKRVRVF